MAVLLYACHTELYHEPQSRSAEKLMPLNNSLMYNRLCAWASLVGYRFRVGLAVAWTCPNAVRPRCS